MFKEPPNWGSIRLNRVGTIYLVVFCIWTTIFTIGFVILWRHRKLPFIRLKNIPLVSWALVFLHLQLSFDILAYPLNGTLPCVLEYWLTSICLPLGIALFQAQNMQLLNTFWGQKQFRLHCTEGKGRLHMAQKNMNYVARCWHWWRGLCYLKRTYLIIRIGTGMQLLCAIIVFFISKRFHNFGLVSETPSSRFQCRAGWEWFPSSIMQAVWTYGFGPFILFRIRKIQDTHRWKIQTMLAILFSLPALPLWLSTWFMEDFYIVNEHWPPGMWFVPGIGMMEFVILFFPIFEIYEHNRRHKRLSAISEHELKITFSSKYTLTALELALEDYVDGLEEFAATKDFTGENIIFLRKVAAWKKKWLLAEKNSANGQIRAPVIRALYDTAEQIYFHSISRVHSTFPLNLNDSVYLPLAKMFCGETSASSNYIYPIGCAGEYSLQAPNNKAMIAPFADDVTLLSPQTAGGGNPSITVRLKWEFPPPPPPPLPALPPLLQQYHQKYSDNHPPTPPRKNSISSVDGGDEGLLPPVIPQQFPIRRGSESTMFSGEAIPIIPPMFTVDVFDQAEAAVKQIVLTNTWIR
ncbi:hypothetical protein BDZ91DRAFT_658098 [Kalaharituber pfeilii]|nr:hypothetical protein BDZ91DRAFT_658098 [Kalaharituber pfeilii]